MTIVVAVFLGYWFVCYVASLVWMWREVWRGAVSPLGTLAMIMVLAFFCSGIAMVYGPRALVRRFLEWTSA